MKFVIHKIESNFWEGFYCFWSGGNSFLKKKNNSLEIEKNRKKSPDFYTCFKWGGRKIQ